MSEAEIQQLIIAGAIAFGGLAVGLLIGIVRGQGTTEKLRGELTSINEELQLALAASHRETTALDVEREQLNLRLNEQRKTLADLGGELEQQGQRMQHLQ